MTRRARASAASAFLLAAAVLGTTLARAAGGFPYRVLHRMSLSGAAPVQALAFGPGGKHLYAAVGAQLRSYDAASGAPAEVVKLPGGAVALAAAARDGGVLYAATRAPARLLILAPRPLRIASSVALTGEPSALLYDTVADALYVESRTGDTVERLDPGSGKTLGVARLHGRLEQMAANGRGLLYVANAANDELEVIETGRMSRIGAIPLSGCSAPSGLAMDPVGRRLFVACADGEALVVDEDMGMTFVRLPIGQSGRLQAVFAFNPLGPGGWKGAAFMAGDASALNAIQMKAFISYVGGGSLPLSGRCTSLAVSPAARRLALALAPRGAGAATAAGEGATAAGAGHDASGVELWVLGGDSQGVSP